MVLVVFGGSRASKVGWWNSTASLKCLEQILSIMSIIHLSQKGGGVDLRTLLSTNITSTIKLLSLMEPSFYVL